MRHFLELKLVRLNIMHELNPVKATIAVQKYTPRLLRA